MNNTSSRSSVFSGQRGVITAIFVASFFVNILTLTAPLYMLQLFSRVMNSASTSTLTVLAIGAVTALIFYFLFDTIRQKLATRLGTRIEDGLGPVVMSVLVQSASADDKRGAQPVRDLQEVRRFVSSPVFIALLDAPWSLVFVAIMFLFHTWLGLVAVAGISVLFALGVMSELGARRLNAQAERAGRSAHALAEEMVRNADIVRSMGKTPALIGRWKARSVASMLASTGVMDRVAIFSSLARFARLLLQIAILTVGMVLVLRGELNPGVMIAASIVLGRAAAPVEQAIAGWSALLSANAARKRLNTLLAGIEAAGTRIELPEPAGRLSLENATVVMPSQQTPLIFDVTFDLRPGDTMGLIGPSGSGKTTLARSLVGLQPLSRGHVRIDDASLNDWPIDQIGAHVGFLPQRVELFAGTIAENIASMDEDAQAADVIRAAKLAQVHEMILALPGGYNADVGLRGERLSAGQRQRIGLARAFYGQKRLIVLDEPNANLDPEGEDALARAVSAASAAGCVVIVVTHRMRILQGMSHAGLMVGGRLAKFGAAREILASSTTTMAPHEAMQNPKVTTFRRSRAERGTPEAAQSGGATT